MVNILLTGVIVLMADMELVLTLYHMTDDLTIGSMLLVVTYRRDGRQYHGVLETPASRPWAE